MWTISGLAVGWGEPSATYPRLFGFSPQDPYDLTQLFLDKAELTPVWAEYVEWPDLLGTDPQGRDVLSDIKLAVEGEPAAHPGWLRIQCIGARSGLHPPT